jgi:hypothetical protein
MMTILTREPVFGLRESCSSGSRLLAECWLKYVNHVSGHEAKSEATASYACVPDRREFGASLCFQRVTMWGAGGSHLRRSLHELFGLQAMLGSSECRGVDFEFIDPIVPRVIPTLPLTVPLRPSDNIAQRI